MPNAFNTPSNDTFPLVTSHAATAVVSELAALSGPHGLLCPAELQSMLATDCIGILASRAARELGLSENANAVFRRIAQQLDAQIATARRQHQPTSAQHMGIEMLRSVFNALLTGRFPKGPFALEHADAVIRAAGDPDAHWTVRAWNELSTNASYAFAEKCAAASRAAYAGSAARQIAEILWRDASPEAAHAFVTCLRGTDDPAPLSHRQRHELSRRRSASNPSAAA